VATDFEQIVRNLVTFYDFAGKTVVAAGAGGGQLVEYARHAQRVIAVDPDGPAIERLVARIGEHGVADKFTIVQGDLLTVRPSGDVVLFEFCLHEMPDPERALAHAGELAPDVLVIDHAPGSRWSWCAAEDAQVEAGWNAVAPRPLRRSLDVEAFQRFHDYSELEAKMAAQGPTSLERIAIFRSQEAISIAMPYRLALL
jgi:SAM-dependent methyltransferase